MFTGRSNSSSSDLSVRGYLPPKGKQVETSLLLFSILLSLRGRQPTTTRRERELVPRD